MDINGILRQISNQFFIVLAQTHCRTKMDHSSSFTKMTKTPLESASFVTLNVKLNCPQHPMADPHVPGFQPSMMIRYRSDQPKVKLNTPYSCPVSWILCTITICVFIYAYDAAYHFSFFICVAESFFTTIS